VVEAGARAALALHVRLPADAGNEYQGLTGSAVLTVTATELPGGVCPSPGGGPATTPGGGSSGTGDVLAAPPGDDLALTGAQAGSVLVTVVVLVAAGCALLRRRRHRGSAPCPVAGSAVPA
jgi:hypothetical protein